MKKTLTNNEIYQISELLNKNPINENEYIPVFINFYIQKNISLFTQLREEIDQCRRNIIFHYGEDKEGDFIVKSEFIEQANKELEQLATITQDVEIYTLPLSTLNEVKLTTGQLKSLMFMVEEDVSLFKYLMEHSPDIKRGTASLGPDGKLEYKEETENGK